MPTAKRGVRSLIKDELVYTKQLVNFSKELATIVNRSILLSDLSDGRDSAIHDSLDSLLIAIQTAESSIIGLEQFAEALAQAHVSRVLHSGDRQLSDILKQTIGVDLSRLIAQQGLGEHIAISIRQNVDLIRTIPEQYFQNVRETVSTNWRAGLRHEQLAKEIREQGLAVERRAKVIARDQTNKVNLQLTQARQSGLGIEMYRWSTSGDSSVRASHAENNGKNFRWSTPPTTTGHPGHDIMCRCVAIPVLPSRFLGVGK